jgi:beta-lactam-binding protein with PASTA domain
MITVVVVGVFIVFLFWLFSGKKKDSIDLPNINFNSVVSSDEQLRSRALKFVEESLKALEDEKVENEAKELLARILPNAEKSSTAKPSK